MLAVVVVVVVVVVLLVVLEHEFDRVEPGVRLAVEPQGVMVAAEAAVTPEEIAILGIRGSPPPSTGPRTAFPAL